jgi:hypothetical protein
MTALGVFRDDYYNAISVLTADQYNVTTQTSGVLPASFLAGAEECFISSSAATALTTDSALNIIAQIQNAVAVAWRASQIGGGGFAAGVNPPIGTPNLFNVTWLVTIQNTDASTLTLSAGAGVTLVGVATMAAAANTRTWIVTVTSPTTVTMQTVGAYLSIA